MKKMMLMFAVVVGLLAWGADDSVEVLTFPSYNDGGVHAGVHSCASGDYRKKNMAVQCYGGTGAYVRTVAILDGGQLPTITDAYVPTTKMFDLPVTNDKPYICLRAVDAGAPTSCTIFLHRERGE